MSPFDRFTQPKYQLSVTSIGLIAVGLCSCGYPAPLMAHFNPNMANHGAECPKCKTQYKILRMTYDANNPGQMKVAIGVTEAAILPPDIKDIIDVSRT